MHFRLEGTWRAKVNYSRRVLKSKCILEIPNDKRKNTYSLIKTFSYVEISNKKSSNKYPGDYFNIFCVLLNSGFFAPKFGVSRNRGFLAF